MTDPLTGALAKTTPSHSAARDQTAALRQAATALEESFLAEMLKHAGFGAARDSFGGGVGEEQFASMLRAEHARALVAGGGIGLAQSLYEALLARETQRDGGAQP